MDSTNVQRAAAFDQLKAELSRLAQRYPHDIVLEALLNTFLAVATAHPCCTRASANAAMEATLRLAHAAATNRPDQLH